MILRAYGDSWTVGEGCNRTIEDTLAKEEKIKYQNEHSWVKFLSDKLNTPYVNNGICGNSNNKIFNKIVEDLKNDTINENDFVAIMWSSSLRDDVPFLPKGEWVSWSVKHLIQEPHKFINSYKSKNKNFDNFFSEYKKTFVVDIFNQNYYNIVSQNYIIFLQKLFKYFNIKYIMCDSFESMLVNLDSRDDITHLVDKTPYWKFNEITFRDFLNKTNMKNIWEYQDEKYNKRATQHPNLTGYQMISEELDKFIKENKII
jgi:hypothetical protein